MTSPRLPRLLVSLPALLVWLTALTAAQAQSPERAVRQVIDRLFDGMRAGDSTMVRNAFDPGARIVTTFTAPDGAPGLREGQLTSFLQAVGAPHDEVWDERIWDVVVHVEDNLAAAWMKYAFFSGERFSHCGVDSFVLARRNEGWKIIHLADTRRLADACEPPPGR
jgi:hypothetical protein